MDKLHVNHSVNWLISSVADHLNRMESKMREVCVWAVLHNLVSRYQRVTGVTNDQLIYELDMATRESPIMFESKAAEYANYQNFMGVFREMLDASDKDAETVILFESLRRLAPAHCSFLRISYARMFKELDRFTEMFKESEDADADAVH
jgi:hypothetical protein